MKKFIITVVTLLIAFILMNIDRKGKAHNFLIRSTGLEWKIDGISVTITNYTGDATTLDIPENIWKLRGMSYLPVTVIGESAFNASASLTSINMPSSVTSIGKDAFNSCSRLTSITVDSNSSAYASVDGVLFDKNLQTIIKYPEGKNAKTYSIPSSVTSIGNTAFSTSSLTSSSLTSVNIPSSVRSIGEYAFRGCSRLASVDIPSSVTSIGNGAFSGCSGLTSVNIPSSVTSIAKNAFSQCGSLTSITIDSNNLSYASVDGVLFDKNIQTLIEYPPGKQGAYSIPSSVTSIEGWAFSACSGLTSITIPSSVTSIGSMLFEGSAFNDCISLTNIIVDSDNLSFASVDGVLFDKNLQTIIKYPAGKDAITYSIPSSVTSIGGSSFSDCGNLTSISIPSSVTSIGISAFARCHGLTSIYLPSSVTYIGLGAFSNCRRLTSVSLSRSAPFREDTFPSSAKITYVD